MVLEDDNTKLFNIKLHRTCWAPSEKPEWTSVSKQISPATLRQVAQEEDWDCSASWRQRHVFGVCCRLAAPLAGVDSLFSSLRLRFIILWLFWWSCWLLWSLFLQIVCRRRAASRSQESINDERGMQALMSLSQRRVDKTQQPLTQHYCLLLFLLQRLEGERGVILDLFLLFAFNSLKPDTLSDIQTCMKNL